MKPFVKSTLLLFIISLSTACGAGKKEKEGNLGDKKASLEKLKVEYSSLAGKIKNLETEIENLDTGAAKINVARLVTLANIKVDDFSHYIDLQGHIDAEDISYVAPRGQGGKVKAIYISKGQIVKKGQLLLKLDDQVWLEQLENLKSQLAFANDIYQRRQSLWKEGIGAEVELLSAKNNVTQLERQMATLKEQWSMTSVYSDVNGFVDQLNIKTGEMFTGSGAMGPQIKIVNTSSLKAVADIPENYLSQVGKGSLMEVNVTDINKSYKTSISFSGASINASTRGFTIEGKLPYDGLLKPNMLCTIRILDYNSPKAVIIPINIVQTDEAGKYVYIASLENGKQVARKKSIGLGMVYGEKAEVKIGLNGSEQIVTQGYQTLYDGQSITAGN